ncbi:MAG: hypothetical protein V3W41_05565 [Planctomycetota bacterium]
MTEFFDRIVQDLREQSPEMLEAGIAPTVRRHVTGASNGIAGLLIDTIALMGRIIPKLVEELEEGTRGELSEYPTRRPDRAVPSRHCSDYAKSGESLVPALWIKHEEISNPPESPLRWLLHLIDRLQQALAPAARRHEDVVAQLLAVRKGGYGWAQEDEPRLLRRSREFRSSSITLERCRSAIAVSAGCRLRPLTRRPKEFPNGEAWSRLRRLLPRIEEPMGTPSELAQHLLGGKADLPDLPFLYQRWCGLQIHRILVDSGFECRGDVTASLFGAGILRYTARDSWLELWIDPRLLAGKKHRSGWTCVGANEATPDLMILVPGPSGPDAFILDPTLSTSEDTLSAKGKYLDWLGSYDLGVVAGVPTAARPPLRSWAIAPLRSPTCKVLDQADPSGRIGVLPLHPEAPGRSALKAFLRDIIEHAHAWGRQASVANFTR